MADMQYLMSRKRELDTLMQMKTSTEKLNKFLVSISSRMDHMNQGMEVMSKVMKNWETVFESLGESPDPEGYVRQES